MNNSDKKTTFRIPDHIISAREFLDLFPSEMSDEEKDKLAAKMEKRYADHQTMTEDEKRFREILGSTGREGVEEFLEYLKVNDFFIAPSSVSHHSNWKGGLVNHSLKVYDCAMQIRETMIRENPSVIDELKEEKVAVAALLHDICKADEYTIDSDGKPARKRPYLHLGGHGTKSVIMILFRGFKLTFDEILAIRWHMGARHIQKKRDREECEKAKQGSALVRLIIRADHMAATGK